eukprot:4973131-Pyramimonas_sp.AAC.1
MSLPRPLRRASLNQLPLRLFTRWSFKNALAFAGTLRGNVAHELLEKHKDLVEDNRHAAKRQGSCGRPRWAWCGPRRALA